MALTIISSVGGNPFNRQPKKHKQPGQPRRSQVAMFDTSRVGTANNAVLGGLTGGFASPVGVLNPVRTKRTPKTRKM